MKRLEGRNSLSACKDDDIYHFQSKLSTLELDWLCQICGLNASFKLQDVSGKEFESPNGHLNSLWKSPSIKSLFRVTAESDHCIDTISTAASNEDR